MTNDSSEVQRITVPATDFPLILPKICWLVNMMVNDLVKGKVKLRAGADAADLAREQAAGRRKSTIRFRKCKWIGESRRAGTRQDQRFACSGDLLSLLAIALGILLLLQRK